MAFALAGLAHAQESKIFQDGRYWVEETSGSIGAARNLKVVADAGSVKIQGAGQPNVTYVIRKRVAAGISLLSSVRIRLSGKLPGKDAGR